jgi:hypothetical protein
MNRSRYLAIALAVLISTPALAQLPGNPLQLGGQFAAQGALHLDGKPHSAIEGRTGATQGHARVNEQLRVQAQTSVPRASEQAGTRANVQSRVSGEGDATVPRASEQAGIHANERSRVSEQTEFRATGPADVRARQQTRVNGRADLRAGER